MAAQAMGNTANFGTTALDLGGYSGISNQIAQDLGLTDLWGYSQLAKLFNLQSLYP